MKGKTKGNPKCQHLNNKTTSKLQKQSMIALVIKFYIQNCHNILDN